MKKKSEAVTGFVTSKQIAENGGILSAKHYAKKYPGQFKRLEK